MHMTKPVDKKRTQITSEFGREPTPEEFAKKLAMSLEKVRGFEDCKGTSII